MAYDLSIKSAGCDHLQSLERYVVSPFDYRTFLLAANPIMNMRAPLNGTSQIQVFIGGVAVPQNHNLYGWQVLKDPDTLSLDEPFFKIMFKQEVRLSQPLLEVSYRTFVDFCLRCNGTSHVNDLHIQNSGGLLHIWGQDKLIQRSLKWILTSTCGFYPQLVCHIKDYIGKKFGVNITDTDISQEVTNALTNMQNIQRSQATIQHLDNGEILVAINGISAQQDPNNPNLVRVSIAVTSNQKTSALQNINLTLRANNTP